jgi:HSP20 family protein
VSAAPATGEPRAPLVELFDEGREVLVVVELRGLTPQALFVEAREDILTVEADGERRYFQELLLPAAVDPLPLQRACRNGIVELRYAKCKM